MNKTPSQTVIQKWLCEPMSPEVEKSVMRLAAAEDVQHIAIMPDVHLANDVCIGTAVATSELIYPAAVGGDIGCGMAAVRFEANASLLETEVNAGRLLTGLHRLVPTNRHSTTTAPRTIGDVLAGISLSDARLEKQKTRDGRVQLGTLGRGNHFFGISSGSRRRSVVDGS